MRIAVLNSGNPFNKKGVMNFVLEKVKRIKEYESADLKVDYYILRNKPSFFNSLLLKYIKKCDIPVSDDKENQLALDGVSVNVLWYRNTIIDQIRLKLINRNPISKHDIRIMAKQLSHYDLLVSHTPITHQLAYECHLLYGVLYSTTWHGSDINVLPNIDNKIIPLLKRVMENSIINYFVSNALLMESSKITNNARKDVYYTGPSKIFRKYDNSRRVLLRDHYNCTNKSIVAFVGSIIDIKNVLRLPFIFEKVNEQYEKPLVFWLIGGGELKNTVEDQLKEKGLTYRMFGDLEPSEVPDIMNCIDVLVLPSKNEGLPLVLLEAITCGAKAVGSNIGGIPEVIGSNNAFDLDSDFEKNISNRIVYLLQHPDDIQSINETFSWNASIEKELLLYKRSVDELYI